MDRIEAKAALQAVKPAEVVNEIQNRNKTLLAAITEVQETARGDKSEGRDRADSTKDLLNQKKEIVPGMSSLVGKVMAKNVSKFAKKDNNPTQRKFKANTDDEKMADDLDWI